MLYDLSSTIHDFPPPRINTTTIIMAKIGQYVLTSYPKYWAKKTIPNMANITMAIEAPPLRFIGTVFFILRLV